MKYSKIITFLCLVMISYNICAQEDLGNQEVYENSEAAQTDNEESDIYVRKNSLNIGLGQGRYDIGGGVQSKYVKGILFSVGYQRCFGKRNRMRFNPQLSFGEYKKKGDNDVVPNLFFRSTTLSLNFHYDIIKMRAVSIVTTFGLYSRYDRGLVGVYNRYDYGFDGTMTNKTPQEDAIGSEMDFGLNLGTGIRIAPEYSKFGIEFRLINVNSSGYWNKIDEKLLPYEGGYLGKLYSQICLDFRY